MLMNGASLYMNTKGYNIAIVSRLAAQVEQLYAPNLSKLTSVYEQVNLSKNIMQGQTFQSLELKDFYGRGIKEKPNKKRKQTNKPKKTRQLNCSLAA